MGGRIVAEDVDAVREATDIVAVVGERVTLKRVGRRFSGLCPFHNEKTASFSVNPERGFYHCFGCGESGNVYMFLQRMDGLSFPEAVELCAAKAGITLRYEGGARPLDDGHRRRRLITAHEAAVAFYHQLLMKGPEGAPARTYWKGRGFDGEDATAFAVGCAPDAWDTLVRHLSGEGFTAEVLIEAGLAQRSSTGRAIDRFRNRLVFPLHNQAGEPVGFGARALPGGGEPKYLNTAETLIYNKGRLLYNLHRCSGEIRRRQEAVLVEGYTDVIALAKAGLPHAVATCGTAVGEAHFDLLRRYGNGVDPLRVVLAFDGDAAGQAASDRGFDLYGRFHLDMRAAHLPEGSDPADFALSDPAGALRAVEGAVPLMQFKLETIVSGRSLADPESRARALHAAAAALAVHPDEAARDGWALWLADWLRLEKRVVVAEVRRARSSAPVNTVGRPRRPPPPSSALVAREVELVRVAVHGPRSEAEMARRWPPEGLSDPDVTAALGALSATQGSVDQALEKLEANPAAASLLGRCTVEEPGVDDLGVWARQVLNRMELDKVVLEEESLHVDDSDDLDKQIALIKRRHNLSDQR